MFGKERDDPVIQQVGRGDRNFLGIELGSGHPRIGVDEGLLVEEPHALHGADIVGVLAIMATALASGPRP